MISSSCRLLTTNRPSPPCVSPAVSSLSRVPLQYTSFSPPAFLDVFESFRRVKRSPSSSLETPLLSSDQSASSSSSSSSSSYLPSDPIQTTQHSSSCFLFSFCPFFLRRSWASCTRFVRRSSIWTRLRRWVRKCMDVVTRACGILSSEERQAHTRLKLIADVPYDTQNQKHEALLNKYWEYGWTAIGSTLFSDPSIRPAEGYRWQLLGFQSANPRTDFRGGGVLSLHCMTYLAEHYPQSFVLLLQMAQLLPIPDYIPLSSSLHTNSCFSALANTSPTVAMITTTCTSDYSNVPTSVITGPNYTGVDLSPAGSTQDPTQVTIQSPTATSTTTPPCLRPPLPTDSHLFSPRPLLVPMETLPLSAALVNLTRVLVLYLRLVSRASVNPALTTAVASKRARKAFGRLLVKYEFTAFEELFCAAAMKLLQEWTTTDHSREISIGRPIAFPQALEMVKVSVGQALKRWPSSPAEFDCITTRQ